MRNLSAVIAVAVALLCAGRAQAQTPPYGQTLQLLPDGIHTVPTWAIWCAQASGLAAACNLGGGGGGGGGGPVTQSTGSSTTPWWFEGLGIAGTPSGGVVSIQGVPGGTPQAVSASSLPLPSGAATSALQPTINVDGGAQAHVMNFPTTQAVLSPQQTPAGDTSVTVPASTSTLVWTTSTSARVLRIVPANATCFMRSDGGTASATSTPISGGYVFNLVEPPPNQNVTAFCTTATTVAVSQGN